MRVEFYDKIPLSGTVPERHYDAVGDCTWVRFVLDDATEWAAVFGNGNVVTNRAAVLFGDGRTALVIAGGQGYVIDAFTGELHHKTQCDYLHNAIPVPNRDFIVACDWSNLYAFSRAGQLWRRRNFALDGIEFDSATETSLVGRAWHPDGWRRFTLDLTTPPAGS